MNVYLKNIKVFQENRVLASNQFNQATLRLIKDTKVYKSLLHCRATKRRGRCAVTFDRNDTISSVINYARLDSRVCALNFADALTPGGMVYQGEVTQEECLCRCTNLYESLIKDECVKNYYKYNANAYRNPKIGGRFTDRVIYSHGVTILRSADHTFLRKPLKCDIVTCPAPLYVSFDNAKDYYNTVLKRIKGFLRVAASHDANVLILGAWGCGAFGGDARIVGRAFHEALKEFHCFDLVVFSVKSRNISTSGNFELLRQGFQSLNNQTI